MILQDAKVLDEEFTALDELLDEDSDLMLDDEGEIVFDDYPEYECGYDMY